jgi:hypothetical protein
MNHRVDGRVRAGDVEVEIHCDSSQLDAAIAKMDVLIAKASKAKALGVLPTGMLIASVAHGVTSRVSRRDLLGLGWLSKG